jgi:putative endopeptidase
MKSAPQIALFAIVLFCSLAVWSQMSEKEPKLEHFDAGRVDRSIDPCQDFYQFACNKWFAANPIPADEALWFTGSTLAIWNETILRETMESASLESKSRTPIQQRVGDFWAACMNEKGIDESSVPDIAPELDRIDSLRDKRQLAEEIAHLHMTLPAAWQRDNSQTPVPFFGFTSKQDFDNASQQVVMIDQGGMALPSRDFYLRNDQHSAEIRSKYRNHITKLLSLSGEPSERAAQDAEVILGIETAMAQAAMDDVSRRDPKNLNNKLSFKEVQSLTPSFDWKRYVELVGTPAPDHYLVTSPRFFKGLEQLLKEHPLEHWKAYLRWQMLHLSSPQLGKRFEDENFDFYYRTLAGMQEQLPRWRRCVRAADFYIGEALGQAYVERAFPPESKQMAVELVRDVENALSRDIDSLDWMSPDTKRQAKEKLQAIEAKVGYPNRWRDYSSLTISRTSYLKNVHEATAFELRRRLAKVGKPVDRTEWEMTPPTINAYYDGQLNTINFPAGILQPPFFDPKADPAVNYAATGAGTIGHEITHGFDDQGRKFDAHGNLRDWWTQEDAKAYEQRGKCFADEYTQEVPATGVKQNGQLTQGEDTADNGGVRIGLMALQSRLERDGVSLEQKASDGWTPMQRFFLAYAFSWCTAIRPELMRTAVLTDVHSLPKYRVNNVVANTPEFEKAFSCKKGSPMAREQTCRVW